MTSNITFSGRATRDNYRAWYADHCREYMVRSKDTDELRQFRGDLNFAAMERSEFLLNNFYRLDAYKQTIVHSFVEYGYPIPHVEALLRLLLRVEENYAVVNHADLPVWSDRCTVMDRLNPASASFEDFVDDYDGIYQVDVLVLNRYIISLLAVLFGDSVVIEVLKRWPHSTAPGEILHLISIVEHWENFKQYPLDWAVSIVSVDPDFRQLV